MSCATEAEVMFADYHDCCAWDVWLQKSLPARSNGRISRFIFSMLIYILRSPVICRMCGWFYTVRHHRHVGERKQIELYKLLFLGHRSLIKKITQTAVINIVFQRIFYIELDVSYTYIFKYCNGHL